jgi:hypothetical protein
MMQHLLLDEQRYDELQTETCPELHAELHAVLRTELPAELHVELRAELHVVSRQIDCHSFRPRGRRVTPTSHSSSPTTRRRATRV